MLIDLGGLLMNGEIVGTVGRGKHLLYRVRFDSGRSELLRDDQIPKDILLSYFDAQSRSPLTDCYNNMAPGSSRDSPRSGNPDEDQQNSTRGGPPSPGSGPGNAGTPNRPTQAARRPITSNSRSTNGIPHQDTPRVAPAPGPGRSRNCIRIRQTARKSTSTPMQFGLSSKMSKFDKNS